MPELSNTLENNRRIAWIDTAKAIAMLLIVFGHVYIAGYAQRFVYTFHVPVFVFLSGYCFSGEKKFFTFLKKKLIRIMVPYYFFGLFAIVAYHLFGSFFPAKGYLSVKDCLIGLLIGNVKCNRMLFNLHLWFLPFIFMLSIMFYWLKRCIDFISEKTGINNLYGYIIVFAFTMVVSVVIINRETEFYLPFSTEIAIRNMPFFSLGFLLKKSKIINNDLDFKDKKGLLLYFTIFVLSTVALIAFADKNVRHLPGKFFMVSYNRDSYGIPIYFFFAAFAGIIAVITLSKLIPKMKWLTYFGRNTMAVLVMQKFTIMPIRFAFDKLPEKIGNNLLICFVSTAVVIAICLLADLIVKKYLPFLYGMRYRKSR